MRIGSGQGEAELDIRQKHLGKGISNEIITDRDLTLHCCNADCFSLPENSHICVTHSFDFSHYSEDRGYPEDELTAVLTLEHDGNTYRTQKRIAVDELYDSLTHMDGYYTSLYECCQPDFRKAFEEGLMINGFHHVSDNRKNCYMQVHFGLSDERHEEFCVSMHHHSLIAAIGHVPGHEECLSPMCPA